MCFIDDSGSEDAGLVVYAWVQCALRHEKAGLRRWLAMRRELQSRFRIPLGRELHATRFLSGRPSARWEKSDPHVQAIRLALAAIAATPEIYIGTVFRRTAGRRLVYQRARQQTYGALLTHIDARLNAAGDHGLVYVDGDSSAAEGVASADGTRLIDDPIPKSSRRSHWVQMADLAAWTVYQDLARHPTKRFAWPWYAAFLRARDVNGGPLEL